MKNVIIALGLTLATSTAALAGGSALDAVMLQQDTAASNSAATLSTSAVINDQTNFARFGDGTPTFTAPVAGSIDYTATASIGSSNEGIAVTGPRLGDGILPY